MDSTRARVFPAAGRRSGHFLVEEPQSAVLGAARGCLGARPRAGTGSRPSRPHCASGPRSTARRVLLYTREVRVVDLGQGPLAAALGTADQAISAVCGKPMRLMSDPASATGKYEALPREAQRGCGDFTLDVLVAAPNDPRLRSSYLFHMPYQAGQTTAPEPPGLDAASRAGSRYVLCLLGVLPQDALTGRTRGQDQPGPRLRID